MTIAPSGIQNPLDRHADITTPAGFGKLYQAISELYALVAAGRLSEEGVTAAVQAVVGAVGDYKTLDVQRSTSATSMTYTVPAGTLDTDEQALVFEAWGTRAPAEDVEVTFGGTLIFNLLGSADTDNWHIRGTIQRVGSSSQENRVDGTRFGGGNYGGDVDITPTTKDLTANQALVVLTINATGVVRALRVAKIREAT